MKEKMYVCVRERGCKRIWSADFYKHRNTFSNLNYGKFFKYRIGFEEFFSDSEIVGEGDDGYRNPRYMCDAIKLHL